MKNKSGIEEQAAKELMDLRKKVAELEALEAEHQHEKMALWERAERYRQVVKKANEAMLVIQSGIIRFVNSKALELFGYSGELTPRSFAEFIHPEDRERVLAIYQKRLKGEGVPETYSFRIIGSQGKVKWLEIKAALISWKNEPATLIFFNDITERKRMEGALKESEEKYRLLVEKANEGICVVQDSNLQYVNPKLTEFLGYSEGELISRPFLDFIHPEDRELALRNYRERRKGEVLPSAYPFRIVDKDGNIKWIELSSTMITWEKRPATLNFLSNITERKQAEEALRASEERYRNLFNNAQIGLYQARISDGLIIEANSRISQIYGYNSREECIGDYVASEHYIDGGTRDRLLGELRKKGEVRNFEARMSKKDGSIFWERFSSRIYPEKGYIEGVVADITEEKIAEEKLRESEERYRRLVENAPLGIISVDRRGQIIEVNPVFLSILGSPSEQATRTINMLTFPPLVQMGISGNIRRCLDGGEPGIYEAPYTSKWGKEAYLRYHLTPIHDGDGQVVGVQAIVEDISERKKLEVQLLQAQKMEAIGTLAGGIAHDFNNILAAIMGYTELANLDVPEGSNARYKLNEVLKASHRAKDLVRQILAFSHQGRQERKPVEMSPLIKEILRLLRASLPSIIEIRQHIDTDTDIIETDPTQIHQVLMNLCTNAAHAMRENGGVLEVSLKKVDMDGFAVAQHPDFQPGSYLRLSVSDTGHGMTREVLKRIFDPYFTTKEVGEGTGLGLAVVHGIVKSHEGAITVYSEPGKGSTFQVYFPRIDRAKGVEATQRAEPFPMGKQECILFVDDEQPLADMGKQMLEHLGYRVAVRMSSIEALKLFQAQPKRFDLVITDMTMPNMTGDKLSRELMGIRPDIPIILCTGFSERITAEKVQELGIREFAMKPLLMSDLAKTIRRVLDQPGKRAV